MEGREDLARIGKEDLSFLVAPMDAKGMRDANTCRWKRSQL